MAVKAYQGLAAAARSPVEAERLGRAARALPSSLDEVTEAAKPLFLEVDLWRLVAVVRDEASMPVDNEIPMARELEDLDRLIDDPGKTEGASDALIQTLFDLSPVAFSISTIGKNSSRYVRVNNAYLELVGKTWEEIRGHEMVSAGLVIGNDARERRLAMLDQQGGYSGERAEIRNARGEIVPILISARRLKLAGALYDFEVITDASQN
jgi:PAS domain-containing protein